MEHTILRFVFNWIVTYSTAIVVYVVLSLIVSAAHRHSQINDKQFDQRNEKSPGRQKLRNVNDNK